jgi:aryl-alcohol dehydrogenase
MKIEAALAFGPDRPLSIEPIEISAPAAGEVLVRVVASGLCHTDLTVMDIAPLPWPAVLGHEGAGVVEGVGAGVTKVKVGDHVVMTTASCGQCRQCTDGEPSYCTSFAALNMSGGHRADGSCTHSRNGQPVFAGFLGQSSFATYVIAGERSVVEVDKDLPLEKLAPLGCGIQTGAGAVLNTARPQPGSSLAVFGSGAVGLSALAAAKIAGCTLRIAVDKIAARLELARELGATHVVDASTANAVEAVREITGGGVDYAIEAAGHAAVMTQAVESLGQRGTAVLVGVAGDGAVCVQPGVLQGGGRSIKGSLMCGDHAVPDAFINTLIDAWRDGRLPFDRFVRFYPFADINRAIADARSGNAIKPILLMP